MADSSSEEDSDSEDECGEAGLELYADPEDWPPAFSTKAGGKMHFQQYLEGGQAAPFCQEVPFKNYTPIDREAVLKWVDVPGPCSGCWRKVPYGLRSVLRPQHVAVAAAQAS